VKDEIMSTKQNALAEKFLAICSVCGRVRGKDQRWQKVPTALLEGAGTVLSHGLCPKCREEYYAELS
jgi:hypothetical protein